MSAEAAFDALGNPLRRELVRLLGAGPTSVGTLASHFSVSRPAVSRHLAVLEGAGLVRHEGQGTRNLYSLDPAGFETARAALESFWADAENRLKLLARNIGNG